MFMLKASFRKISLQAPQVAVPDFEKFLQLSSSFHHNLSVLGSLEDIMYFIRKRHPQNNPTNSIQKYLDICLQFFVLWYINSTW